MLLLMMMLLLMRPNLRDVERHPRQILGGLFGGIIDQEVISMLASLIKGDFRVGLLLLQLLLQFTVTEVAVIGAGAGSPRRRPRR